MYSMLMKTGQWICQIGLGVVWVKRGEDRRTPYGNHTVMPCSCYDWKWARNSTHTCTHTQRDTHTCKGHGHLQQRAAYVSHQKYQSETLTPAANQMQSSEISAWCPPSAHQLLYTTSTLSLFFHIYSYLIKLDYMSSSKNTGFLVLLVKSTRASVLSWVQTFICR